MKLTPEEIDDIKYACLDDSTKIIMYLEESNKLQKKYNILALLFTVIGAIGSIIAAITGVILLFH
ncbi:hypothetical protein DW927_03100 [Roseburia intestinalis]|uniref:Uncharacterized protein n=1 Tax=Roseburia intestinalis TaxID=166486 RepID=A0A3R6GSP1_9FIRM|nr:hypothetical protein [Roseburia intestinalis]RHA69811.1 hypothetical protein DW927_03100 [Roseburia intestinalis]